VGKHRVGYLIGSFSTASISRILEGTIEAYIRFERGW
jgi:hypothetical protein